MVRPFVWWFSMGSLMTLAVLMDATLVRATLVPAFMRLAGDANWWAPSWMRRIYDRAGMSEAAAEAAIVDLRPAGSIADDAEADGEPKPLAGAAAGSAPPDGSVRTP